MVDDESTGDGEVDNSDPRRANRNSQLYQASNADKLMETELTKLRGKTLLHCLFLLEARTDRL